MKSFAILALISCSNAITLWTTKGQIAYQSQDKNESNFVQTQDWVAGDSGTLGPFGYERELPERFSNDDDDIFMRSMLATYASETADGDGKPSGKFVMPKAAM